ncbi:hypothetical protein LXA43DRAFT_1092692 [Ganoderma leucocontextum]|nr:hypothetical protein LXA43DRAFT_1092692 [Ganoderma leucocontextum]
MNPDIDSPDHQLPRHIRQRRAHVVVFPSYTAPIDPSSLLLAEHLRLTKKNWAAYKRAVPILWALKGVDEHLRHGADASSDKKWRDDDTLCRAVILFNIKDDSHLRLDSDPKHACELWKSLVHMLEGKNPCPIDGYLVEGTGLVRIQITVVHLEYLGPY